MSANDPMRTFGLAQQVKASWEGSGYHRQAFGRRTTVVVPLSVINSVAAPRVRMVLVLSMSKTAGTPPGRAFPLYVPPKRLRLTRTLFISGA